MLQEDIRTLVRITLQEGAQAPSYGSGEAAGADIHAWLPDGEMTLQPGAFCMVPTGVSIALPSGYEAQVRPRSGLAAKYGITVLNSPGTIDSDYRGEIKILLINHGQEPFVIHSGDRIAQMIIARHEKADFHVELSLDRTVRGTGGFGSTGI